MPIRKTLAFSGLLLVMVCLTAFGGQPDPKQSAEKSKPKLGLQINEASACKGYTLLAPISSTSTFLIDMEGKVVHTWKTDCHPGQSAYLLDNGHLLRTGLIKDPFFFGGGVGGRIQEFTWDGELVWDYACASDTLLHHHDVARLPNGNILINAWEKKSSKDAIAAGRRQETVADTFLLSACIQEVQPTGKTTGKVVWEWHAWDHLIQEFDPKKANHGDVGAHPELIDLNFGSGALAAMIAKPDELEKLRAIGYVGGAGRKGQRPQADWLHINAIAYNAELDQIMVTIHEFSEFWIIDHGTTKAETASHAGGKRGKGGDLLYRWGNPSAYRAGSIKDQKLFGPHNSHWIARGLPGETHIIVFNNGMRRTGGAYSTVEELVLPLEANGQYALSPGKPYGPDKPEWTYVAPKRTDFFASFISGAERLPNGNTLICSGPNGTVFEVTPKNATVWKFINPSKTEAPPGGRRGGPPPGGPFGAPGDFGGRKLGQIAPPFLQNSLELTADQKKQLEKIEKDLGQKLENLLKEDQKKRFAENPTGFQPGLIPLPGHLFAPAMEERLKLRKDQQTEVAKLQKEADAGLQALLKDDQKKRFKESLEMARNLAGSPPGGGRGGPPGGGIRGPGGISGASLFRAVRYAGDYPGLAGKELKGAKTIEEMQATPPKESAEKKPVAKQS